MKQTVTYESSSGNVAALLLSFLILAAGDEPSSDPVSLSELLFIHCRLNIRNLSLMSWSRLKIPDSSVEDGVINTILSGKCCMLGGWVWACCWCWSLFSTLWQRWIWILPSRVWSVGETNEKRRSWAQTENETQRLICFWVPVVFLSFFYLSLSISVFITAEKCVVLLNLLSEENGRSHCSLRTRISR